MWGAQARDVAPVWPPAELRKARGGRWNGLPRGSWWSGGDGRAEALPYLRRGLGSAIVPRGTICSKWGGSGGGWWKRLVLLGLELQNIMWFCAWYQRMGILGGCGGSGAEARCFSRGYSGA